MTVERDVARHYAREGLEEAVRRGLAALGGQAVRPEDLAALDEFHMGGRAATEAVAATMGLTPGMRVLDIGCGLGGTARLLAGRYGCRVTGIDLMPAHVALANELSRLVGLDSTTRFETGSALDLPRPASPWDAATLLHVGMNIPDKERLFAGVARVLAAGGIFAVYDVMRTGAHDLPFPLPWAGSRASSFLETPAFYRRALEEAGFAILDETSHRELARKALQKMRARTADGPPPLGLHLVMGESAPHKIANMTAALDEHRIAPVAMLCRLR